MSAQPWARAAGSLSSRRGSWTAIAALAVLAAVVAAVMALLVFPHGSSNNDEAVYLLQARAIAHGHLFTPVGPLAPADRLWFFTAHHGDYVSKYLPTLSLVLGASIALTGQYWPALSLIAALLPVTTYLLARAAHLSGPRAVAAAALVTLSPLVAVQSGLALTYVAFAVVLSGCWILSLQLLDGHGGIPRSAALGALVVVAATLREYDTVLLLLPFLVRLLRSPDVARLRTAGGVVLGAVPFLVLVLAYDAAATGSATKLPFGGFSPSDTIGFGRKRLFPEDSGHDFGVLQALTGTAVHFLEQPLSWYALGLLVLPAAVAFRQPSDAPRTHVPLLLSSAAVFLVGYAVFWGPWNASVLWGGPTFLGPMYALILLVPLSVAAVPTLSRLRGAFPRTSVVVLLAALALNGVRLVPAIGTDLHDTRRTEALLRAVHAVPADHLLVVDDDPAYLLHPVSAIDGRSGAQQVLGPLLDPARIAASRPVTLLVVDSDFYGGGTGATFAVTRQQRLTGAGRSLTVGGDLAAGNVVLLREGGTTLYCAGPATVVLSGSGPASLGCADGQPLTLPVHPVPANQDPCPTADCVDVTVYRSPRAVRRGDGTAARRLVIGSDAGSPVVYADAAVLPAPLVSVMATPPL